MKEFKRIWMDLPQYNILNRWNHTRLLRTCEKSLVSLKYEQEETRYFC